MTGRAPGIEPRIRDAVAADARAIAEIRVASWRAAYAGIVPASILDGLHVERTDAWMSARIDDPGTRGTLVIEGDDGRPAGYALIAPTTDADAAGLGEVEAIYLAPDARGRGLGRPLLDAAADRLADGGFRVAVLWVLTANLPARRFYERAGWAPDEAARMLDFDGTPIEEIRYRRSTG